MGRRKLSKKKRITSITLSEEVYEVLIKEQENISKYIEELVVTDLNNKQHNK